MRYSTLTTGLVLFSSSLTAQLPLEPAFGPFSTTGIGFAKPTAPNDLTHYRPDTGAVGAFPSAGGLMPNFSRQSIFAVLGNAANFVEIDAISTGNDLLPVTFSAPNGTARIVQLNGALPWSALFFSVRNQSVNPSGTSPMSIRRARGGAGADVYSWITPGSSPLGEFEDRIFLDVPAETLGVPRGQEISALDIPMALLAQANGDPDQLFTPVTNKIFFSVTKDTAQNHLGGLPGIAQDERSCGTIFSAIWDSTTSSWGPIEVAMSANSLGLSGISEHDTSDDEDLDALAVDARQLDLVVVFSTDAATSPPQKAQLLAAKSQPQTAPVGPFELRDQVGNALDPIAGGVDVDAVCGIDPETGTFCRALGTPYTNLTQPPLILSTAQMLKPNLITPGTYDPVIVVDVNGPVYDPDIILPAYPLELWAAPTGLFNWVLVHTYAQSWNGSGTARVVLPQPLNINAAYTIQARWVTGLTPVFSTLSTIKF